MDYCNERWRSYMGLEMEGARGDGWQTMLHPDDRDRVLKAWHESVVNGTPYEQEERHRRADGTYRWFLSRGVPLRDVEGRIVRWYGTNTDIEDRKRAEAMLKEREEHLRVLLENVPVAVYTCDREGLIEYYNPKAVEMWGRAPVLRDTMQRYCGSFALYHTDGTPMPFEDNIMAQVIRSGIPQRNQEVVIGRSDGTRVIALVNVAPLRNERGELIGAVNCILDISDRKRAEEALNAHALRYKTLMETSTDSIYVLDEKGDLQEANAAFLRRRGYTAAEVKGLNVADWDAQWSREQLQERLRELIGSSAVFETRHRDKDGSVFDVEVSATSVRIGGEQLFFVVTRDITERKRAEDRLRRSEEKFKALFGIAPVGISVLDRQHNVVDANPALEQITRLSKEELLNGTYRRRAYLNADGTPKPANELASERAVTENRPINNVETGIVTENGEIIWTQVSVAPLALPDASAVVITQDITERRSAEEDLKKEKEILAKVFDNIPVMIGFVGADGDVKLVNPEWERAIGWTLKELREQNVDIFVEAYPDLSYRQEVLDFVTASTGEWADLKIRVRDGRVIDAACAVVHLSDGTKVAIAQDITERKQAEEKLKATSDQLRALSARLQSVREEEATRIAREIHDELGQQLTGLKLDLRRAERKVEELESSPAVNSLLDTLVSATELADGIITTVQKIATELRPGVLDKLGLGAALQYEARRFQERSEIRCEVRLPEAEPSFSTEISTALFRIFQECLTNVARHAHASEVEAELKLEPGAVILSVHDNGRGVTPSAMATRTALGLLGMKERAALLGGEIVFHSGPDQGTTVTVRLPHIGMPPPSQAPV
jgi:PAS domain S-box-containing protein